MPLIHVDGLDHSKSTQAKIMKAAKLNDGSLANLTDKGALFRFSSHTDANAFRSSLRSFRVFTTEIEE